MKLETISTPTDLQSRYEQQRAAWQRDVWAVIAERLEEGMKIAERKEESGK